MEIVKLQMEIFYVMIRKNRGKNKEERHILNTKMKTIIAILGILAFIYSLYMLWKIITLIRK